MEQVVAPRWPLAHPEREGMGATLPPALGSGFAEPRFPARPAARKQASSAQRALPALRSPPSSIAAPVAQRVELSLRGNNRPCAVHLEIAYESPARAPARHSAMAMGCCETF